MESVIAPKDRNTTDAAASGREFRTHEGAAMNRLAPKLQLLAVNCRKLHLFAVPKRASRVIFFGGPFAVPPIGQVQLNCNFLQVNCRNQFSQHEIPAPIPPVPSCISDQRLAPVHPWLAGSPGSLLSLLPPVPHSFCSLNLNPQALGDAKKRVCHPCRETVMPPANRLCRPSNAHYFYSRPLRPCLLCR